MKQTKSLFILIYFTNCRLWWEYFKPSVSYKMYKSPKNLLLYALVLTSALLIPDKVKLLATDASVSEKNFNLKELYKRQPGL